VWCGVVVEGEGRKWEDEDEDRDKRGVVTNTHDETSRKGAAAAAAPT
jgi:hypothetical protein